MSGKAKAINSLYRRGRITLDGVREAVSGGVITKEEYKQITGHEYAV